MFKKNKSKSANINFIRLIKWLAVFVIILVAGIYFGYFLFKDPQLKKTSIVEQKNIYINFIDEIYDKIKANYWEKITDEELTALFKLGAEKLTGTTQDLSPANIDGLNKMILKIINDLDETKKRQFIPGFADIVLKNLKPLARSGLYTRKKEKELSNLVQNINPEVDLYANLGLLKGAPEKDIAAAYEKKKAELEKQDTPEAKEELKKISYAQEVLAKPEQKQLYDQAGIEPTVFAKLVRPDILHLRLARFSPTTFEEFQRLAAEYDKGEKLDTLIFDLRGNIGGAIDAMPYFLGPFIGKDQYAYELYHQGEKNPMKTVIGWLPSLVRYKKVIILIDDKAQSSAEIMAASLKKYNVGVTVGLPTKGWGTIERVFELENQISPDEIYSMFLVHTITLRDDGEPIEGRGVDPLISVKNPDWTKELYQYFNSNEIVAVVKQLWDEGVE